MPRTALGALAAGLLVAFAALALAVELTGELPGDGVLTGPSSEGGRPPTAVVVDRLTGYAGMAVLAGLLVLLLGALGRRRQAVLCAVSVAGALVGNALLKQLVARARPEVLPESTAVSPFSFPSGHAAATAAVVVTVLLAARGTRALVPAAVVGALVVVGAAAAQLVLAQHRPSDLAGGWLWAAAWTTAVWAAGDRRRAGEGAP